MHGLSRELFIEISEGCLQREELGVWVTEEECIVLFIISPLPFFFPVFTFYLFK